MKENHKNTTYRLNGKWGRVLCNGIEHNETGNQKKKTSEWCRRELKKKGECQWQLASGNTQERMAPPTFQKVDLVSAWVPRSKRFAAASPRRPGSSHQQQPCNIIGESTTESPTLNAQSVFIILFLTFFPLYLGYIFLKKSKRENEKDKNLEKSKKASNRLASVES